MLTLDNNIHRYAVGATPGESHARAFPKSENETCEVFCYSTSHHGQSESLANLLSIKVDSAKAVDLTQRDSSDKIRINRQSRFVGREREGQIAVFEGGDAEVVSGVE